jgi:hypothetical protein
MSDLDDLKERYVKDPKDLEIVRLEVKRDELQERVSELERGLERIFGDEWESWLEFALTLKK